MFKCVCVSVCNGEGNKVTGGISYGEEMGERDLEGDADRNNNCSCLRHLLIIGTEMQE